MNKTLNLLLGVGLSLSLLLLLVGWSAVPRGYAVLIERTEPAYTVYAGIPGDKVDEVKRKLADAPEGITLIDWDEFNLQRDQYIKKQIIKDEYPDSRAQEGVIELIRQFPGTPIGLTWNGGIAITFNDYQHAKRIYQQYQTDPEDYERNRNKDPRADPINPQGHLGPLLGW